MPTFTHCRGRTKKEKKLSHVRPEVFNRSAVQQHLRLKPTHPGVASEEPIRNGNVDVERQRFQDVGFHVDELAPFVSVVADVEEILDGGRAALLQPTTKRLKTVQSEMSLQTS